MDSCTESDSEEVLVYVEIGDDVEIEQVKNINVLGVDTKNPLVQMDDNVFTGKYQNPLGTYMFFKDAPPPQGLDPVFDQVPDKNLEYLCMTRKLIKMEHAYITPNINSIETNPEISQSSNIIEPISFKSYEEAIDKFKGFWKSIESGENIMKELKK